jgi:hypothetical protein
MEDHLPKMVSADAFEAVKADASRAWALLYTVVPALCGAIVFLFFRVVTFGEKVAVALTASTEVLDAYKPKKE